jgi:hypothetical protein
MLMLALLNRQRQPGRSMSLVVSRQREAEIPLVLMMHPHSVWPAISDVANSQRAALHADLTTRHHTPASLSRPILVREPAHASHRSRSEDDGVSQPLLKRVRVGEPGSEATGEHAGDIQQARTLSCPGHKT